MPAPPFSDQITFAYVDDAEAAWAFYADVLGLNLIRDQGACRIYRTAPGASIGICRRLPGRPEGAAGVTLTLVTDDIDGWYARLQAAGVHIARPLGHSDQFKVTGFLIEGPEGQRIEIQSFDQPLEN